MLIVSYVLLAITILLTIAAFSGAYILRKKNLKRKLTLSKKLVSAKSSLENE